MTLRLRELRDRAGLTQEALAYKAGLSVRTVIRAEAVGRASQGTLSSLADALAVSIGDLFTDAA